MDTVRVTKADLIEKLTANRDEHRALFLRAQEKFRDRVIEELDKRLLAAREGHDIDIHINLPIPADYTQEYDNAIELLKWEVADEVDLSQRDFNQLVLNQWSWAQAFAAQTTSYLAN